MRVQLYRGWWYAVWRDGGTTKRRALRTQDRDAALRNLEDYRAAKSAPRHTISAIYDGYLAAKGKPRAEWAWDKLKGSFGALRPEHVTEKLCHGYGERRRLEKIKDGTIHTELTFLRAALNWHRKGLGDVVVMPPKPPPNSRHLSRPDFMKFLGACKAHHLRLFVMLGIATAGRMGAILELTWDRVDMDAGTIRLAKEGPQTKKGRATVPMTAGLRRALQAAEGRRGTGNHVVEFGGEPVKKIRKAFARAASEAGLPWVTPHVLRHTAAVWMAEADVPMSQIAQYLGHTDERTTFRVYARYTPEHLRKAAESLDIDGEQCSDGSVGQPEQNPAIRKLKGRPAPNGRKPPLQLPIPSESPE
jgi:integrase